MEAPALQHQLIDLLCTNISVFDGREEINEILPVRKFRINLTQSVNTQHRDWATLEPAIACDAEREARYKTDPSNKH